MFKKFLTWLIIFSIFSGGTVLCSEGPRLELAEEFWDFGRVAKPDVKEKVFEIKNTGDGDLILKKINACCSYDVVDVSSWTIVPNGISEIAVACYSKRKKPGKDYKYITVLSNDARNPELKIVVKAEILAPNSIIEETMPRVSKILPEIVPKIDKRQKQAKKPAIRSISPKELYSKIQSDEYVIILDVREKNEYTEMRIANSTRYSRSRFGNNLDLLKNIFRNVDAQTLIAVHCATGARSGYVARKLEEFGYNAYNLEGGIKAWEKTGFPVVNGPKLPPEQQPLAINSEEAYEHYYLLFHDKSLWIDTRDYDLYQKTHIKGAVNLPVHIIEQSLDQIPKDEHIILYCSANDCESSTIAGEILLQNGYKQGMVRVFTEGFSVWKKLGYPVES